MDIRAVAFDVNGTLVRILADDDDERIFRAAAHFLTYQGIDLHRHELRELYFQLMKEQKAASPEPDPEFETVLADPENTSVGPGAPWGPVAPTGPVSP